MGTHLVFHVSQLKKHCGPNAVPSPDLPLVGEDGTIKTEPLRATETRAMPRNTVLVMQWLIKWANLSLENASWEDANFIKGTFPKFY